MFRRLSVQVVLRHNLARSGAEPRIMAKAFPGPKKGPYRPARRVWAPARGLWAWSLSRWA